MHNSTPLPFPLECNGKRLVTFEDAAVFVLNLSEEARGQVYWQTAYTAFNCATMEPAYRATALAALEMALTLDALVDPNLLSIPAKAERPGEPLDPQPRAVSA